MPARLKRTLKRWRVPLALAAVMILVLLMIMRPKPSLVDRSIRLPVRLLADYQRYGWLSDGRLLRVRFDLKRVGDGHLQNIAQVDEVDAMTGKAVPLTELNARLAAQGSDLGSTPCLSPDHRWVLYLATGDGRNAPSLYYCASEIGGAGRQVWPVPDYTANRTATTPPPWTVWLPNSRQWLELAPPAKGRLEARLRTFDSRSPDPRAVGVPTAAKELLGVTADRLLVATDFPTRGGVVTRLNLFEIGLDPSHPSLSTHLFRAPGETWIGEMKLSPQGDRLAWKLYSRHPSAGLEWLQRFLPSLFRDSDVPASVGLWVSRRDGSELREIGYQGPDVKVLGREPPGDIRWTPNGKRLSFLFRNALYTVPVDR